MQIRKSVGWVGAGKGLGSRLEDSCNNPGVRQPRTWRRPRDYRGGTGKRNDRLDGSKDGEGPEETKMAEVSALVLRSGWWGISLGQEIGEFNLGHVKGLGNSQVKYVS